MTRNEYYELQALYEREGRAVYTSIANVLNGIPRIDRSTLISAAYVLLKANDDTIETDSLEAFCSSIKADEDRKAFLESNIGDTWQMVVGQRFRYNSNVLKSIILFHEDRDGHLGYDEKTPASISRLACKLFNFSDNDEIADFGIGSAAFTIEAYLDNSSLQLYGIDYNAAANGVAAVRLDVLGCAATLEYDNILDIDPESHQYQHIFSNYPFGLRLREIGFERSHLLQRISQKAPGLMKSVSSDWFFNAAIVECLKENGRAIAITTNGSTWNTMDKNARKYFIENGYLEAVIALPERMFEGTRIPTTMIIMSRNNKRTMLVDATEIYTMGRRQNIFTDEQIEHIAAAVDHKMPYSKCVSQEELIKNDYVINPTRYLTEIIIKNGAPFSEIIKSITRGAPVGARDLDQMTSQEPTDYQYLMLANIQNGQIDEELPYLTGINENQKRHCLKNRSLILSKNGTPFKIAVAEVPDGKTILASGNLYIIELDEDKADPYYIKAFLESEKGRALLKSITVGAVIPSIGVDALRRLSIPLIPIEEQHALAARYLAKIDEIALYQRKLEKAYEELSHIYDDKE